MRFIIEVTHNIVDFFINMALATSTVGMECGGFVFGNIDEKYDGDYIINLVDFVQSENVSKEPSTSYKLSTNALVEAFELISTGKYDVLTHVHTHPTDDVFSPRDVFNTALLWELIPSVREVTLNKETIELCKHIPQFVVTGGKNRFIMTFTDKEHVVKYILRFGVLYVDSKKIDTKMRNDYVREVKELVQKEALDLDLKSRVSIINYVRNLKYTIIKEIDLKR